MNVLVLGGTGMLGHKLWQAFSPRFETYATVRGKAAEYARFGIFAPERLVEGVSVEDFSSIERALERVRPAAVVNCIGIVKQAEAARDPLPSIEVNSLFPHRLARAGRAAGARLVHISTDCVFSGRRGMYREEDVPDAEDLYGRSKLLGEVEGSGSLTLRTSMIGRELETSYGLVEWFLGRQGETVRGFKRAIFSGLTTKALADVLAEVVERHQDLEGVWHLAAEPIAKYDLLGLVKDAYGLDVAIEPDDEVAIDRSLDGSRFQKATGIVAPSWVDMIAAMAADDTPYADLRRHAA